MEATTTDLRTTPPGLPTMLTVAQVARALALSRSSVIRLLETESELGGWKAGSQWRVPQANVLAWVESQQRIAPHRVPLPRAKPQERRTVFIDGVHHGWM